MSYEAVDLINSLLQEKEYRLCSKQYEKNDSEQLRLGTSQLMKTRLDKHFQDFQGHFVYSDDASDIKAHPFFQGLSWERLHLSRPPFVPDVKGRDDTKYFDEEEPVSDVDDASTTCSVADLEPGVEASKKVAAAFVTTQVDGGHEPLLTTPYSPDNGHTPSMYQATKTAKTAKPKEKKRPRDRALRDKDVGRTVLEIRKRGAFPGYTYRRSRLPQLEEERGRQGIGRRSKLPSMN